MSLPLPEYESFDAIELAAQLRAGAVTPLEALEAALARADAHASLNALSMRHDELARDAARRLSALGAAERAAQAAATPLWGVPFALKDLNLAFEGTVTTNGCAFFRDAAPADHDSTLVQRYRAAGFNIFAKTTSPEFGQAPTTESALFGPTRNPWNPAHSSGGSSGGAAVAVAAGILPVANASDGGGSIRIPASHCGLFGLKPSRGLVPMGPRSLEGWMGLSCQHVISRSVRDSALVLALTQGPEAGSRVRPPVTVARDVPDRPPRRLRIALMLDNPFGQPVDPECLAAAGDAARLCESLGHHVEPAAPVLPMAEMYSAMGTATSTGMLSAIRTREKLIGRPAREDEIEPINWRSLQAAAQVGAEDVLAARRTLDQVGRTMDLFFAGFDIILSPVTAGLPPLLGEVSLDLPWERFLAAAVKASPFTAPFNMSGHPAMSVPLHLSASGLPVGVQFAGGYGQEATLLALAAELEHAAPWAQRRPPL